VVDLDHSFAARMSIDYIDATPEMRVTSVCGDFQEAQKALLDSEVLAVIVIPPKMLETIKRHNPVQTTVLIDPRNLVVANSILSGMQKALGYGIAGARFTIMKRFMVAGDARERVLPLKVLYHPVGNPSLDYSLFIFSAVLLLLIQQCLLVGSILGLARETEMSTLAATTRICGGPARFIFIRHLALMSAQIPLLIVLLTVFFGVFAMSTSYLVLSFLSLVLFSASIVAFSQVIGQFFNRRLIVMVVMVFFSLPAFFLSGYTWPLENMPVPLQWLAQVLPSTPALHLFLRLNSIPGSAPALSGLFFHLAAQYLGYLLLAMTLAKLLDRQRRQSPARPPGPAE
jgi:ABC-2 type transport system permease protein